MGPRRLARLNPVAPARSWATRFLLGDLAKVGGFSFGLLTSGWFS